MAKVVVESGVVENHEAIRSWLREWLRPRIKKNVGADFWARQALKYHFCGRYVFPEEIFSSPAPVEKRTVDFLKWL